MRKQADFLVVYTLRNPEGQEAEAREDGYTVFRHADGDAEGNARRLYAKMRERDDVYSVSLTRVVVSTDYAGEG